MRKSFFILLLALPVLALELTNRRGFLPQSLKVLTSRPDTFVLTANITDITDKSGLVFYSRSPKTNN